MATKEETQRREQQNVQFNNSAARAVAGEKRNNAYDISIVKYPSDLGAADLLHYVQFAINVRSKSNFNYKKTNIVEQPVSGAKLDEKQIGAVKVVGELAAGATAGLAVTALADKVAKAKNTTGGIVSKALGFVTTAVVSGNMMNAKILQSDQSQRISDVIALHVDGPPTVKYGMQYSNKDLGAMAGVIGGLFGSGSLSKTVQGGPEMGAAIGMQFAKLPGALGGTDLGAAIGSAAKVSLNPFREVIFEAVDFRTFAFRYKFLPKNKKESDDIKRIINLFKFHMHPEVSPSKLFFVYPSEFQITYFFKGKQNEYFHSFRPCVLDSMEVTYGGEQFSSFKDGQPSEVNMSLVFRETEILTKEMIGNKGTY